MKLQRFRRLTLEAVKILSGEKILFSLTSIRHWIIKFRNIWIFPPLHISIQHIDTWARWSVERNGQFNRKPRSYKM